MNNNPQPNQNYPQQNYPQAYGNSMNYSNQGQPNPYGQAPNPNFQNNNSNAKAPIPTNMPYPGVNLPPYVQPQPPMQQGYGMNPNMGGQYGYQNPNMSNNPYQNQPNPAQNNYYPPQGQQPQYSQSPIGNSNVMLKNLVTRYSDIIFMKYDSNRSGFLDVKEIYPAVCELFVMCGVQQPSYPDVISLMRKFDKDGNGLIDMNEFRTIMLQMNGF